MSLSEPNRPISLDNEDVLVQWPSLTDGQTVGEGVYWRQRPRPTELGLLLDEESTPPELIAIIEKASILVKISHQKRAVSPQRETTIYEIGQPERHGVGRSRSNAAARTSSGEIPGIAISPQPSISSNEPSQVSPNEESPTERTKDASRKLKTRSFFAALRDKLELLEESPSQKLSKSRDSAVRKSIANVECASCLDDIPTDKVNSLDCQHAYCTPCFETLISTAMQTESMFPPKCCLTEIPLQLVLRALDRGQRDVYKQKAAEWTQPAGNRWYCPDSKCGKWIPPSKLHRNRNTLQKCPHCKTKICGMCRGTAHEKGAECPQDFGLEAALEAADREGWQRCYSCRALVEKTTGCRHITCKCKAEFCYTCGSIWKTCQCTELDETRRQEQVRERRAARDTEAQEEEEEIARAIAQIEEMERIEEQRKEEERRWEEDQLRILEQIRQAEEEKRRREEEEAERKRIEVVKASIEGRGIFLVKYMRELLQYQQMALISRHECDERRFRSETEEKDMDRQERSDLLKAKMQSNIEKRSRILTEKHEIETVIIKQRHEQEEDESFLDIQQYLRGKPNREAREKALIDKLKEAQETEMLMLIDKHKTETFALSNGAELENEALERSLRHEAKHDRKEYKLQSAEMAEQTRADQKWFEFITRRRCALLEAYNRNMLTTMGESGLFELDTQRILAAGSEAEAVAAAPVTAETKSPTMTTRTPTTPTSPTTRAARWPLPTVAEVEQPELESERTDQRQTSPNNNARQMPPGSWPEADDHSAATTTTTTAATTTTTARPLSRTQRRMSKVSARWSFIRTGLSPESRTPWELEAPVAGAAFRGTVVGGDGRRGGGGPVELG